MRSYTLTVYETDKKVIAIKNKRDRYIALADDASNQYYERCKELFFKEFNIKNDDIVSFKREIDGVTLKGKVRISWWGDSFTINVHFLNKKGKVRRTGDWLHELTDVEIDTIKKIDEKEV